LFICIDVTQLLFCPYRDYEAQHGDGLSRLAEAVAYLLKLHYANLKRPDPRLTTQERNNLIRELYAQGESLQALAQRFGISFQRIHQIVHFRRK
jgi:hypothetical protein